MAEPRPPPSALHSARDAPGKHEARLWARHGAGDAAVDEFEMYMRLLGWRMTAEYHREVRVHERAPGPSRAPRPAVTPTPRRHPTQAREGGHAFSSTVYVLRLEHAEAASDEDDD